MIDRLNYQQRGDNTTKPYLSSTSNSVADFRDIKFPPQSIPERLQIPKHRWRSLPPTKTSGSNPTPSLRSHDGAPQDCTPLKTAIEWITAIHDHSTTEELKGPSSVPVTRSSWDGPCKIDFRLV
ncbi:unnamed protein product [Aspergillus oryzae var. brunneus]|uniref:Unnamed protein product n=2 Tax=Aspergillus oryzae TaxID=5062 RepID=A0AAN5BU00_ASPOZ|nr:unnamed protein product [Aspergillus oryzae]GMG48026.1 unnamed protein product [Aspergillus oryzae var. brunneus]